MNWFHNNIYVLNSVYTACQIKLSLKHCLQFECYVYGMLKNMCGVFLLSAPPGGCIGQGGGWGNSYYFTLPRSASEVGLCTAGSTRIVRVIPCNGTGTITIIDAWNRLTWVRSNQYKTFRTYFIFSLIRITVMGSDDKINLYLQRHHTTLFGYILVWINKSNRRIIIN